MRDLISRWWLICEALCQIGQIHRAPGQIVVFLFEAAQFVVLWWEALVKRHAHFFLHVAHGLLTEVLRGNLHLVWVHELGHYVMGVISFVGHYLDTALGLWRLEQLIALTRVYICCLFQQLSHSLFVLLYDLVWLREIGRLIRRQLDQRKVCHFFVLTIDLEWNLAIVWFDALHWDVFHSLLGLLIDCGALPWPTSNGPVAFELGLDVILFKGVIRLTIKSFPLSFSDHLIMQLLLVEQFFVLLHVSPSFAAEFHAMSRYFGDDD